MYRATDLTKITTLPNNNIEKLTNMTFTKDTGTGHYLINTDEFDIITPDINPLCTFDIVNYMENQISFKVINADLYIVLFDSPQTIVANFYIYTGLYLGDLGSSDASIILDTLNGNNTDLKVAKTQRLDKLKIGNYYIPDARPLEDGVLSTEAIYGVKFSMVPGLNDPFNPSAPGTSPPPEIAASFSNLGDILTQWADADFNNVRIGADGNNYMLPAPYDPNLLLTVTNLTPPASDPDNHPSVGLETSAGPALPYLGLRQNGETVVLDWVTHPKITGTGQIVVVDNGDDYKLSLQDNLLVSELSIGASNNYYTLPPKPDDSTTTQYLTSEGGTLGWTTLVEAPGGTNWQFTGENGITVETPTANEIIIKMGSSVNFTTLRINDGATVGAPKLYTLPIPPTSSVAGALNIPTSGDPDDDTTGLVMGYNMANELSWLKMRAGHGLDVNYTQEVKYVPANGTTAAVQGVPASCIFELNTTDPISALTINNLTIMKTPPEGQEEAADTYVLPVPFELVPAAVTPITPTDRQGKFIGYNSNTTNSLGWLGFKSSDDNLSVVKDDKGYDLSLADNLILNGLTITTTVGTYTLPPPPTGTNAEKKGKSIIYDSSGNLNWQVPDDVKPPILEGTVNQITVSAPSTDPEPVVTFGLADTIIKNSASYELTKFKQITIDTAYNPTLGVDQVDLNHGITLSDITYLGSTTATQTINEVVIKTDSINVQKYNGASIDDRVIITTDGISVIDVKDGVGPTDDKLTTITGINVATPSIDIRDGLQTNINITPAIIKLSDDGAAENPTDNKKTEITASSITTPAITVPTLTIGSAGSTYIMPTTGPTLAGQVLYATGANVVGWNTINAGDSYSAGINIAIDGSTQKTISLSNPVNITSPSMEIVAGTTKVVDIALNSTTGAVTGNTAGISCSNKYTTGGVETVGQSVAITPTSIELNKIAEGANPAYVTEITAAAVTTPLLAIGSRSTTNYTFPKDQPAAGQVLTATSATQLGWVNNNINAYITKTSDSIDSLGVSFLHGYSISNGYWKLFTNPSNVTKSLSFWYVGSPYANTRFNQPDLPSTNMTLLITIDTSGGFNSALPDVMQIVGSDMVYVNATLTPCDIVIKGKNNSIELYLMLRTGTFTVGTNYVFSRSGLISGTPTNYWNTYTYI